MKKQGIFAAVLALSLCLSACGCNATTAGDTIPSTTANTTPSATTTVPMVDPTMDTNIPDPTVDSNSTENGGLMDTTGVTEGAAGSTGRMLP